MMKLNIAIASICFCLFAEAATPQYDPYVIAGRNKSEYTSYLQSVFDKAPFVSVEKVSVTAPQIKKNSTSYRFRTEIIRQSKHKKANFAGRWVLSVIGCGTGCNQYFVTNVKTGQVIDPNLMTTNGTPLFVKNKNILITGGSIEEKTLADAQKGVLGGPKSWIWKFIEQSL
jgi:hypothetical protein